MADHVGGQAVCLGNLGYLHYQLGDYGPAQTYLEKGLTLRREIGYPRGIALTLTYLGHLANVIEDYQSSQRYYYESLKITTLTIQAMPVALDTLGGLALCFIAAGNTDQSLKLLTLVFQHPATTMATKKRATQLLTTWQADLPSESLAIIQSPLKSYTQTFESIVSAMNLSTI